MTGCVLWRIGFTGELSFELHAPAAYGLHLWESLMTAGRDLGVRPFGMEAQRILRLEKGHLIVGQDTDGLTRAGSAGLDGLVKLDKPDFVGLPELVWQRRLGGGTRLVGLCPSQPSVVPAEGSQLLTPDGAICGRVTSSRLSPTLGRAIALAQVDAAYADPGSELTIRLVDGREVHGVVSEQLAQFDSEGAGSVGERTPVARSPIPVAEPQVVVDGWLVSGRTSQAELTLTDLTPLTKVALRVDGRAGIAAALATGLGRATWRHVDGVDGRVLVTAAAPAEWLLLAAPGQADAVVRWLVSLPAPEEFVTVVDLTHGRAVVRVSGARAMDVLAKECAVDLGDRPGGVPDGRAVRTAVAGLATELVRADVAGTPSYLLHCERSSGEYLFDSLLDSGAEHGIDVDGFSLSGFDH